MYQFILFIQPLTLLTIIYFITLNRNEININKYIIAIAIVSMWSYVLYSSGSSLVSQKWNDTLSLLIASPTNLFSIILSKVLSNSLISLISFFLTLLYAKFIFQFELEIINFFSFTISILTLILSLSAIGIILSVIFTVFKNVFNMQNIILYPILMLSGVFYPISYFPFFLNYISYLLPMTWAIKSIYYSLENGLFEPLSLSLSISISIIYFLLSYTIVKKLEKTLKIKGTIGVL